MRPSFFTAAILSISVCGAQTWVAQASGTTVSLRGVSVVDEAVVWASGAGGTFLRTVDGGARWHAAVVPGAADLDFRAVHALDRATAWLMSSGPGAKSRIYRTVDGGGHWLLLFTNPDADGFLDAMAFWDAKRGVVLGDPVDGYFVILTTEDGGQTWARRKTPAALPKEGAFAASNSALTIRGEREIWFATGGAEVARVFHSEDGGQTWNVASTPCAGIYSLSFADRLNGVAVGGDYTKLTDVRGNVAITSDGGRRWIDSANGRPHGYRSAVAYLTGSKLWIAVGTSGSDVSRDGGKSWTLFDEGAYHAIGTAHGDTAWATGPDGRVSRLRLK